MGIKKICCLRTGVHYFSFTISAGATRTFDLTVIDDNILEGDSEHITMYLGVYEYGDGIYWCDEYNLDIEDNDGKSLQYYIAALLATSCFLRPAF